MSSQWEHDAWREGANRHPVAAVVLMPRRLAPHVTQPTPLGRRFNQEKLLQDLRQPVPPLALQQLRQEAGALVTGVDNATHLLQVAEKWYPRPPRPDRRPDQPAELANSARHMWDIFKQMGNIVALHRALSAPGRFGCSSRRRIAYTSNGRSNVPNRSVTIFWNRPSNLLEPAISVDCGRS